MSSIRNRDYPGKTEILASWRWGVSLKDDHRPITTIGEATDAMGLAYRAFEERDEARAALGTLPEALADAREERDDLRNRADRLQADCLRALGERNQARAALKTASSQRTVALVVIAALVLILAFAL